MIIELIGGPGDGVRVSVPDETRLWTMATLLPHPVGPYLPAAVPHEEHRYLYSRTHTASGARRFWYLGSVTVVT